MDAVLMCGGRGTRLDAAREKPLVRVAGAPMVDRVLTALSASGVDGVYAAVSPHAPDTRSRLSDADCAVVETAGEGYVADLSAALDRAGTPALTVAADLPLLDAAVVDRVTEEAAGDTLTVAVPAALKRRLGLSVGDEYRADDGGGRDDGGGDDDGGRAARVPAGVNVVGDRPDRPFVSWDARLAVNVNRPRDRAVAEALLSAREETG